MKLWDPHFHIWDVSPNTSSGHDPAVLFAPEDAPIYSLSRLEADLAPSGLELIGGAFVEATSVCHIAEDGWRYSSACIAETWWGSQQFQRSPLDYRIVSAAPLEDPQIRQILSELTRYPNVCGIRQILNHEPSWPRNGRLGNLFENEPWRRGYAQLADFGLSFDLQLNPHQFRQAAALSAQHPEIPLIIGHLGSPTLEDLQKGKRYWEGMQALADLPHASIKLSMLSYPDRNWETNALVKEAVLRLIDLFGVDRCFFASNFPVEAKDGWPAEKLFRELRNLVSSFSAEEQQKLFATNAQRVYARP